MKLIVRECSQSTELSIAGYSSTLLRDQQLSSVIQRKTSRDHLPALHSSSLYMTFHLIFYNKTCLCISFDICCLKVCCHTKCIKLCDILTLTRQEFICSLKHVQNDILTRLTWYFASLPVWTVKPLNALEASSALETESTWHFGCLSYSIKIDDSVY